MDKVWKRANSSFKCSFTLSSSRAQLFEDRLALTPRLNLTGVSFFVVQKHFLGQFSLLFYPIINLLTKRIKLNLLFNPSYLNSNLALTLGYLNPALNNPAQAPVVQKVDSAIHWISLYPVDSAIGFPNTYLLDRDLSDG